MASSVLAPAPVDYPSSDGRPVAESDHQFIPLTYAASRLRQHFRQRDDVYVAGNLLIYYEEGTQARVAPDVFVVLGAPRRRRSSYLLWKEPKAPDFVLEITSRGTRGEDQGPKRDLYRRLGVTEYWQYDPTGDYLEPALQGLGLVAGEYVRLGQRELADGTLVLTSAVLELELRLSERGLRFHDPVTGRDLPDLAETDAAHEQTEQRWHGAEQDRQRERQAREQAEQRWQRAEQDRQRERQARERAEQDRQRERQAREQAEQRWQRAEQDRRRERQARQEAEARIAELEARLRDRRNSER